MTAIRPPGFSTRSAATSARSSTASSSLTAMRRAWKTRERLLTSSLKGTAARTASASWLVVSMGRRARLLAVGAEDVDGLVRLGAVDEVGGGERRVRVHPHVERPVGGVGEAARGLVDLVRGDAEVEEHAVHGFDAGGGEERFEVGKV